eukprot:m.338848 g.338848  ORF g.338848 m.338848 type:complete len:59 (+) comp27804_c6_seq1:633-809(+)
MKKAKLRVWKKLGTVVCVCVVLCVVGGGGSGGYQGGLDLTIQTHEPTARHTRTQPTLK